MGRAVVRTRLLTVAGELSAIGGTEVAQLRVMEGLASRDWDIELLYVRRGDLWPRWKELASNTRTIRSSGLRRSAPFRSSLGALGATIGIMRSDAEIIYLHSPGDLPSGLMRFTSETNPGGAAPSSTASLSPAGVDESAHPPGRRRDHPLVRCSGPMDTGSRAGERPGVGDPHRDRHRALRSHCRHDRAEQRQALGIEPGRPHDSLRGPT